MLDIFREQALTLQEVARLRCLRRDGKRPHYSTIWRWVHVGIRGIRLEAVRVPGRLVTSREAVERFIAALTGDGETPVTRSAAARRRAHEAAEAELTAEGI